MQTEITWLQKIEPRCKWKFKPQCEHKHDLDRGKAKVSPQKDFLEKLGISSQPGRPKIKKNVFFAFLIVFFSSSHSWIKLGENLIRNWEWQTSPPALVGTKSQVFPKIPFEGCPNASSALRSHLRPQPVRMISSAIIMALPFFGAAQKYLYLYSDPYKYSLQTFAANIVLAHTKQYYNQNKY